jgi:integrase
MFTGFNGSARGYRTKPGDVVRQDASYWLPILALWTGARLEELGAAKLDAIANSKGIAYFDWRDRNDLKTPAARRVVPIHPKLIGLGFLKYVEAQRKAGADRLFPELPHDDTDAEASTRAWGKWWGLWSSANGFAERELTFHSFRHTFARACRGKIDEEVRDLLMGHKGQGSSGRDYGSGADLKVLANAMAKVAYPTFPLADQ